MRRIAFFAAVGVGLAAAVSSAHAGGNLPQDIALRLDKAPVGFTMTEAKRQRLMMIQENMARQRYYQRRHGYRGGYGYGYGGPPPWAPAYGYRRGYYERW